VGVIEEGRLLLDQNGTYQGSVISPVLANVYPHEVLDLWFEKEVKPRMRGEAKLYRYADDLVVSFEFKEDADRFMEVLPKRFGKYGLKLHPEKTRLIEFGKSAWAKGKKTGTKPATFNFLGLTHYCGTTRKGKMVVKVKTMGKRFRRGLKRVADWCRRNLHLPVYKQQAHLKSALTGHYNYYGRRTNYQSLRKFHIEVLGIWKYWLGRRSQNGYVSWDRFQGILRRYPLPRARITQGAYSEW
jgi:RNA-directed DNA polymerase